MTMGNFTTVGVVEESTPGTTPASALRLVNCDKVSFKRNAKSERPQVFTGDRRRYPTRVLSKSGTVSVEGPMQYENDLEFLEGLLNNTRASAVTVTGTTIAATSTTITDSGNGLGSFAVGDMVFLSGFAGTGVANNSKWVGPVTAKTAGALTIPTGQLTAETAGATVTVQTRRLIDGSTLKTFSLEEKLTKLTNEFQSAKYGVVQDATFSWEQGSWARFAYNLLSKVPAMGNATIGTGGPTAAKTAPFMNSVDDFQYFRFGNYGTTLNSMTVTKWSLMIKNVIATIFGLSNVGPSAFDPGPFDGTIDLSIYYDDNARDMKDAIDAHETLWANWGLVDPAGNRICFSAPACKAAEGDIEISGAESEVNLPAKLTIHDPAKDSDSDLVATGISQQFGIFFVPAS